MLCSARGRADFSMHKANPDLNTTLILTRIMWDLLDDGLTFVSMTLLSEKKKTLQGFFFLNLILNDLQQRSVSVYSA